MVGTATQENNYEIATPIDVIETLWEMECAEKVPLVRLVPEMPEDEHNRDRAQRLIKAAGATAINIVLQSDAAPESSQPVETRYANLLQAVRAAAKGDEQALKLVTTNAGTDSIERTIKAGHVTKVELATDNAGKIWQHGQTMDDVYVNSLRYVGGRAKMLHRTEAETRNGSRIEYYNRQGTLEDFCFVVVSRCADDMSDTELEKAGFFTDTKSCVIQVTSSENGKLTTESAFVAGVTSLGAERHDTETVVEMGRRLGVDLSGMSAAEIIDSPMLVSKRMMPNGAVDIAQLYDACSGHDTFFGQAKPAQDYAQYRDVCRKRESEYKPRVQKIVSGLLASAATLKSPEQASQRLHELSQAQMVDHAIVNHSIDPRVFGATAAAHIEQARHWQSIGEHNKVLESREKAQKTAVSSSCASGSKNGESSDGENMDSPEDASSWTWKQGICRVNRCPSPKPTEVGPCSVCRACQQKFDSGQDPTGGSPPLERNRADPQDVWKYLSELLSHADEHKADVDAAQAERQGEADIAQQVDEIFTQRQIVSFEDERQKTRQSKLADSGRMMVAAV